jgi:hypothetical protein
MALNTKQLKEAVALLKEQAKLQQEFSNDFDAYLGGLKKANAYKKELNRLGEIEKKLVNEVQQAATGSQAQQDAQDKLNLLRDQTKELQKQADILDSALKDANKSKMLLAKGGAMAFKSLGKIPGMFKSIYSEIKGFGLFEMDKAVKKTALSMGVLSKENLSFTENLRNASLYTTNMGISLEELAQMQADFSNELGRSVVLSEAGLKAMSEMAAATGLGTEGTSKMVSDMTSIGYSAEKTRDFIADTMNNASKIGLNASKVVKNIQQNIKLLNKFNFKNGAKGLAKMAETTTKLGVDMGFASGMAEKLFDIEGAVDMSAQLQVMGGEWAKLADPFKLMYMARNDMEGLTAALGEAAKSAVHFNEKSGEFEISALEMHRLRKIAEQTGVAYEDLAQAGRNAAILSKIKSQVNFSVTGDKELAEYMTNKATFKDGKAEIMVNGKPKLLKMLDAADRQILKDQIKEEQNLAERAKQAQTFDESLTNLINMFKVTMLPIVDGINDVLKPLVQDIFKNEKFKEQLKQLGKDIAGFIKKGAEVVKWLAELAVSFGPKGTLAVILGAKGLMSAAGWIANGLLLAQGFNMGTGKGFLGNIFGPKGKMYTKSGNAFVQNGQAFSTRTGGKLSGGAQTSVLNAAKPNFGNYLKSPGAIAGGVLAGGLAGYDEFSEQKEKGKSTGEAVGRGLLKGLGAGGGAMAGAALGALLAPATGGLSLLLPLLLGGAGAAAGGALGDLDTYGVKDGIFGKTNTRRAILQEGKVTPIDSKDDLLTAKNGGAVHKALNTIISQGELKPLENIDEISSMRTNSLLEKDLKTKSEKPQIMKHIFEDININGSLMLSFPGGQTQEFKLDKDPVFIRKLTEMIHSETEKAINGGKN